MPIFRVRFCLAFLATALFLLVTACNQPAAVVSIAKPNATSMAKGVASPTPAATSTPTSQPSPTLLPSPTASNTPTPTFTTTVAPTLTDTSTATSTPTRTPTDALAGPAAITVRKLNVTSKVVALTFDAGAGPGHTSDLLALLKRDNIKVTFGMTGRWAESNPGLLREMAAGGHEFMNHTYDHHSFTGFSARPPLLTRAERTDELDHTERIVHTLTGSTTKPLFRPPYGDYDQSVLRDVASDGYRYSVLWTVDSGGWQGHSIQQIVDKCLKNAQPGAIFIFHLDSSSRDIEAVPTIIAGLKSQGYSFATVGELLHLPEASGGQKGT